MMQPALRIKKDPIIKKIYHFILLICREARANQQGHIRSVKPIGLLKRINSSKDINLLGKILCDIV